MKFGIETIHNLIGLAATHLQMSPLWLPNWSQFDDYFSFFGHLQKTKFAKVSSKLLSKHFKHNKDFTIFPNWRNLASKSGH